MSALLSFLTIGSDASWLKKSAAQAEKSTRVLSGDTYISIFPNTIEGKSGVFLPWVERKISYTPAKRDVISGPFSGCLMTICTSTGAGRQVCHVHTEKGESDCKLKWNKTKELFSNVKEFLPSQDIYSALLKGGNTMGYGDKIYCLITAKEEAYAILVSQEKIKIRVKCKPFDPAAKKISPPVAYLQPLPSSSHSSGNSSIIKRIKQKICKFGS